MAASDNDAEHGARPDFDVFVHGTVFFDLIFTGLESVPPPGVELQASGMGSSPGGIANLATASSRLGLLTSMSAAFGDDVYGDFCWSTLSEQEGVDLSSSRRFEGWHSPVTVSMATRGDRSMVTHSHPPPLTASEMIGTPPRARAVVADLDDGSWTDGESPQWLRHARSQGATVFADIGWDESGEWAPSKLDLLAECDAFLPNAGEAMAYTRTDSPRDALYALADRVPIAVVTNGADGAMAIDSRTGEEAQVPALNVPAIDATGAGDVFVAGIMLGTLGQWPLTDRLAFAALCSALAVQQFGGSLSSPGLAEVLEWWRTLNNDERSNAYVTSLRRRYAFLDGIRLPSKAHARRLAEATFSTHPGSHMTPR
ncbi:carbohydrate kinase family protein [Spelaeicoccus albus]|uniref:Sugar/nucleoside kinase (Ribokinase family) n=1 Tax=Spelaeicoccus albus TaxID=1280376 RepID=A0A7Z0D1V4_9MICO|nr:PfkB family carbohydrate kinase [Spelaeicoccus albus]NYI67002.1 sugar/nucleoside kinase (ribokinase family) [Spelaeicoccus albus]